MFFLPLVVSPVVASTRLPERCRRALPSCRQCHAGRSARTGLPYTLDAGLLIQLLHAFMRGVMSEKSGNFQMSDS